MTFSLPLRKKLWDKSNLTSTTIRIISKLFHFHWKTRLCAEVMAWFRGISSLAEAYKKSRGFFYSATQLSFAKTAWIICFGIFTIILSVTTCLCLNCHVFRISSGDQIENKLSKFYGWIGNSIQIEWIHDNILDNLNFCWCK